MFRQLIHDGYSFYGINDTGALLWYRDAKDDGTVGWAPNSGKQIGIGWGDFIRLFPGSDAGEIYGVKASGDLFWFRDILRDGSNDPLGRSGWDHASGAHIGVGWNDVLHVFPGPNGVIYAVKPTGELLWFKDLKTHIAAGAPATSRWANNGVGKQIGVGWHHAARIVSSRRAAPPQSTNDYVIYFIRPDGGLCWYHDDRADGSNDPHGTSGWAQASGTEIGVGWDVATMVMGGAAGVLYIAKPDGALFWYQDILRDGTSRATGYGWAPNSGRQAIGSAGWIPYPTSLPATLQYDLDSITFSDGTAVGGNAHLTLRADGTLTFWGHFHNSGAVDENVSFVMLVKDVNDIAYTLPASGHISGSLGSGSHDLDWRNDSRNDAVAKNWPALVGHSVVQGTVKADSDVSAIVNLALASAGVVLGVVALIVA